MGFLHSKPEEWKHCRAEVYQKNEIPLGLPDLEAGGYLVSIITQHLGWSGNDGMGGLLPHSWTELEALDRHVAVGSRDLQALREMSEAYISGRNMGAQPMTKAPVYETKEDDPGIAFERQQVVEKFKASVGGAGP